MADLTLGLEDVLAQWRALPAGDRKAILKRLPLEQRIALERALSHHQGAQTERADLAVAREFAQYSPWLAELVAGCMQDNGQASGLKSTVCGALRTAHAQIAAQPPEASPSSLWDVIRQRLRDWGLGA